MSEESFLIRIIVDAQNKAEAVLKGVAQGAESVEKTIDGAAKAAKKLDEQFSKLDDRAKTVRSSLKGVDDTGKRVEARFKGIADAGNDVNRGLSTMDRRLEKSNDSLKTFADTVGKVEKKFNSMLAEIDKAANKKVELEVDDTDVDKTAAKVDALALKLLKLERKKRQITVGIEREIFDRDYAKLEAELDAMEGGRDMVFRVKAEGRQETEALLNDLNRRSTEAHTRAEEQKAAATRKLQADILATVKDTDDKILRSRQERAAAESALEDKTLAIEIANIREAAAERQRALSEKVQAFGAASNSGGSIGRIQNAGVNSRDFAEIQAELQQLGVTIVKPSVGLNRREFEIERRRVEQQLTQLGLSRAEVKVVLDSRNFNNGIERASNALQQFENAASNTGRVTIGSLINSAITLSIVFAEPVLSALTSVAGALIAVGVAAGEATAGLAGLASAGLAQAIPVAGLFAAAFSRVGGVLDAVKKAQAETDKGAEQGVAIDNARINAADGVKSALEGVAAAERGVGDARRSVAAAERNAAEAQRRVVEAQDRVNEARREGVRALEDLRIAQERSSLSETRSRLALAATVGSGRGLVQSDQLDLREDSLQAGRASADNARGQAGGVSGTSQVRQAVSGVEAARRSAADAARGIADANRNLADAIRGVDRANDAVTRAQRQFDTAAVKVSASASAADTAFGKLTEAEQTLFESVQRFQALFREGGAFTGITDPIVLAFASALDRITGLLSDAEVLEAFRELAGEMGETIDDLARHITTGPIRDALIFFTNEASDNVGTFGEVLENLISIFTNVARAASPAFRTALNAVNDFLERQAEYTGSAGGQSALSEFFSDALVPLGQFLELLGAVAELFFALVGADVGTEGGNGIERLTNSVRGATDYVNNNKEEVRKFFRDSIDGAAALLGLLLDIAGLLVRTFNSNSVRNFAEFIGDDILPIFEDLIKVLGLVTGAFFSLLDVPIIGFLIKARLEFLLFIAVGARLVSMLKLLGFSSLLSGLGKLAGGGGFGAAASGAGRLTGALDKMRLGAGLAFESIGRLISRLPGLQRVGDAISRAGGRVSGTAAGGAAAGGTAGRAVSRLALGGAAAATIGLAIGSNALGRQTDVLNARDNTSTRLKAANDNIRTAGSALLKLDISGFVGSLLRGTDTLTKFSTTAQDTLKRLVSEENVDGLKNLAGRARELAKEYPSYAESLEAFAVSAEQSVDKVNKLKFDDAKRSADSLKRNFETATGQVEKNFARMTRRTKANLSDIRDATELGSIQIKNLLGENSNEANKALSRNFAAGARAVKRSMENGRISVKTGTEEYELLMTKAFQALGFDAGAAVRRAKGKSGPERLSLGQAGNRDEPGLAGGGWVGRRGERGADSHRHQVGGHPVGRGEAVLNWAHQRVVEPAMNAYYGSGLGDMFKRIRAEHAGGMLGGFARGGYVQQALANGGANNLSATARAFAERMFAKGFNVTSAYRPGDPRQHGQGNALDFGDSVNNLGRVWQAVFGLRAQFNQLLGPPGLYNGTQQFQDPGLQADHRDHVHIGFGAAVKGALGAAAGAGKAASRATVAEIRKLITRVKYKGGGGQLGALGQATLDRVRQGAIDKVLEAQSGGGDASVTGGGRGDGSPLSRQAVLDLAGKALRRTGIFPNSPQNRALIADRARQESGYDPDIVQQVKDVNSGGNEALGLMQVIPGTFAAYRDKSLPNDRANPFASIVAAIRYMKARYGRVIGATGRGYNRGGLVPGIGDDDTVEARLTPGEHVWTKQEVQKAGGHGVMHAMRRLVGGGGQAQGDTYGVGGTVADNARSNVKSRAARAVVESGLVAFNESSSFEDQVGTLGLVIRTLKQTTTRTASGLVALTKGLDLLTSQDVDYVAKLVAGVAARVSQARTTLTTSIFRSRPGGGGEITRGGSELGPLIGERNVLVGERGDLREASSQNAEVIRQATRALARARASKSKGDIERALKSLNSAQNAKTAIDEALANNAKGIVEATESFQSAQLQQTNAFFDRFRSALERVRRVITTTGRVDVNVSDAIYNAQIKAAKDQISQLGVQLAAARRSGNAPLVATLEDQIAELDAGIIESAAGKISAARDIIVDDAARENASLDRRLFLDNLFGRPGAARATAEGRIDIAQREVGRLTELRSKAGGNPLLQEELSNLIKDLQNTIGESTRALFQAVTDEIEKIGARANAGADYFDRYANVREAGGDRMGALDIRRNTLQQRINADNATVNAAWGPFIGAFLRGDVAETDRLKTLIDNASGAVHENTQALKDNAFQMRQLQLDIINGTATRATGLIGSARSIFNTIDTMNGRPTSERDRMILESQAGVNATQREGLIGQAGAAYWSNEFEGRGDELIGALNNAFSSGPDSFAETLRRLAPGIASYVETLGPAQAAAFNALIDGMVSNSVAVVENTSALKSLDSSVAQTFSTTAWKTFRQAIFDGNGGLLPRYSVPALDTGGTIMRNGMAYLHRGEEVVAADVVRAGMTMNKMTNQGTHIEQLDVNVTNPTEVLDVDYIGSRLRWSITGGGRL